MEPYSSKKKEKGRVKEKRLKKKHTIMISSEYLYFSFMIIISVIDEITVEREQ